MKLLSKLILGAFVLTLCSCVEYSSSKEITLQFQDENRTWLPSDTLGQNFIMKDNNGISQSFAMNSSDYYFNTSIGSIFWFNTDIVRTEYHYQDYNSSYGNSYTFSLTAGHEPFGDEIYVSLNQVEFAYDLLNDRVSRIYSDFGYNSLVMTDEGYEVEEEISSEVEIMESFLANGKEYENVLKFEFKDFETKWTDFTVVNIYIAKGIGLIRYDLNNGIYYERN